jgi:predicted O-methyltransferase YrrM
VGKVLKKSRIRLSSFLPQSLDAWLVSLAWHVSAIFLFLALWNLAEFPELALLALYVALYVHILVNQKLTERKIASERKKFKAELKAGIQGVREELSSQIRSSSEAVRESLGRRLAGLANKTGQEAHTVASAVSYLTQMIRPSKPIWFTRDWAASPELLANIYALITQKKPELVLDLGSGLTTLVAGYALRKNGYGHVVAWEHLDEYSTKTMALVGQHGLNEWAAVYNAPLEEVSIGNQVFTWYSQEPSFEHRIDLLIVDGPPADVGEMARYPAIPLLLPWLSEDATIVLDDVDREDEKSILEAWESLLPNKKKVVLGETSKSKFVILQREN